MRISHINAVYDIGSTGTIVKDLQELCIRDGIDCEVVYSVGKGDPSNSYHMGNLFSNKLHALMTRISGKQGYFSWLPTTLLLKHYDRHRPDIVHLHNLHGSYINVPMLLKYASKHNIAVVVSLHDCWFYTGGCTHYTSANCFRWKELCGNCPRRYDDVDALMLDGTSKMLADRVRLFGTIKNLTAVGVSQWIADEAAHKVFKNAKSLAIHNGIDTEFFRPVESDFRKKYNLEDKFLILAPANKWFLEINRDTFEYFASRLADNMRMVFIGNGVDEGRLTDKMINIGFVNSREEIRAIYSACDVMINCTREESLSLLNIEVQSCGTPVITYSNTGAKETVDGICGFAVKNGDPESAWNAMMTINENSKSSYADACLLWVKQKFNKEVNCRSYIKLYHNLFM